MPSEESVNRRRRGNQGHRKKRWPCDSNEPSVRANRLRTDEII